jgi:peptide/nickel transport system substrate-binding protein
VTKFKLVVLFLVGLLICGTSAFIACGPEKAPMVSSSQEAQKGGVLKLIGVRQIGEMGPFLNVVLSGMYYRQYVYPCFDTLLDYDENGNFVPRLATAWQIAPDEKSITLTLRKGVKFHDGTDFNAEAVRYYLNLIKNSKDKMTTAIAKRINSMDVLDDYTLRLNLKQFDTLLLDELASDNGMIPSKAAMEANINEPIGVQMKKEMVGTGPFKFVDWQRDAYLKFTRNTNYWEKDRPYLDGVEFTFIVDPVTSQMSFQAGESGVLMKADPLAANDLKTKGFPYKTIWLGLRTLVPDGSNPDSPFAKKEVREALEYAIDKEAVCKAIGMGFWYPYYQAAPQGSEGYISDLTQRKYNPEKAKQILAAAGYPTGLKTQIIAKVEDDKNILVAMQNSMKAAGIDASLEICDKNKYMTYSTKGWNNGLLFSTYSLYTNGSKNMRLITASAATGACKIFRPSNWEDLFNGSVTDNKKHTEYIQTAYRAIYDNVMFIPLWEETEIRFFQNNVRNTGLSTVDMNYWKPQNAWLTQSK